MTIAQRISAHEFFCYQKRLQNLFKIGGFSNFELSTNPLKTLIKVVSDSHLSEISCDNF